MSIPLAWQTPMEIRRAAILTNDYVAADVIDEIQFNNQVVLHIYFTKGSLDSCEIKIEFSPTADDDDYTQETNANLSGGETVLVLNENTITGTGNYTYFLPQKSRYVKVSAQGTGDCTGSSLRMIAAIGQS